VCVASCVFITTVPITKLFALGEGIVEDMCYEVGLRPGVREGGGGERGPGGDGKPPGSKLLKAARCSGCAIAPHDGAARRSHDAGGTASWHWHRPSRQP
jgi:hypothetical protein